jgi:hypothetical protein
MNRTHGGARTRLYSIWAGMKARCYNKNTKAYPNYGGRGINICERWLRFECFRADMGDPPSGASIERIDNDKGYEPGNCCWATRAEQSRNRRNVRMITANGKTMTATEWAEESGIPFKTIFARLSKGWSESDAVTFPNMGARRLGIRRGAHVYESTGAAHDVQWSPASIAMNLNELKPQWSTHEH